MTRIFLFLASLLLASPALAQTDEFFFVGDTGNTTRAQNVAKLGKASIPADGFGVLGGDERYDVKKSIAQAIGIAGYGELENQGRLIAAPGNHDLSGCNVNYYRPCIKEEAGTLDQWLAAHPHAKGRTFFTVEKRNIAFIVVNGNKNERDPRGMKAFAESEARRLKAKGYRFIAIVVHQPFHSSRGSRLNWDLKAMGINIALGGHHHFAELCIKDGVHHFTNGLGGHSTHPESSRCSGSQWFNVGSHGLGVLRFSVSSNKISWKLITTQGATLHAGSLTVGQPLPPEEPPETCADGTILPPDQEVCPGEGEVPPPDPDPEPQTETASGTMLTTPTGFIRNHAGNLFHLEQGANGLVVYRNYAPIGETPGATAILYYRGVVYAQIRGSAWIKWNGYKWQSFAGDPRVILGGERA
jgi:predicted phosphodiesterase